MMQDHIGAQLKEKLAQVLATGKLKTVKKPAVNAAKQDDPTKPLHQALSIVTRIMPLQGMIPKDETLRRLNAIRQLIHQYGMPLDEKGKAVTQMRRSAEACQNYLGTIATGIRENDVDVNDLGSIRVKLAAYIREVEDAVVAYNDKSTGDEKAKPDEVLTESKMRKFSSSRQVLVSRVLKSNRITVFAKMPVLVICDPAVRTIDLQDAGLSVEGYDGLYSVILDQQVIGITNDPPAGETHDSLLQKAIASVSRAKRVRYSVVSDQPVGFTKYNTKFYWVADPQTLAVFDNVKGNHVQVAKWSFPF